MTKQSKPKLTLFLNEKAGKPIKKNDGTVVTYNGEPMLHCNLNGIINLPDDLPAGNYEVAIYKAKAKSGSTYYSGTIKPKWEKDKAPKKEEVKQEQVEEEFVDDDIPF